jgi:hypothetical protein
VRISTATDSRNVNQADLAVAPVPELLRLEVASLVEAT